MKVRVQNPIILRDNARRHTAAVTDLLCRWQRDILEHSPCSPDMCLCDYNVSAKAKEPLRGIRYNTRNEFIHDIWRLIRNINKYGRADSVRRFQTFGKRDQ